MLNARGSGRACVAEPTRDALRPGSPVPRRWRVPDSDLVRAGAGERAVEEVRDPARLHPDRDRGRHDPPRALRGGERSGSHRSRHRRRYLDPGALLPPERDDGPARGRTELRSRRPALREGAIADRPHPVARQRPGTRCAFSVDPLPAQRDRAQIVTARLARPPLPRAAAASHRVRDLPGDGALLFGLDARSAEPDVSPGARSRGASTGPSGFAP
jgi:hypothetical protein